MVILRKPYAILAALIASVTLFSNSASAVQTINFPDFMTTNLVYTDVEESNNSIISGQTLFGGISTSGDAVRMQATNFSVSVNNSVDLLTGNFDATITAKPGQVINGIRIEENGSAMTFGAGSLSYAKLQASVDPANSPLQSNVREYSKLGTAGLPSAALWSQGFGFRFAPTGEILLSLRNQLIASAGVGQTASISKDEVRIFVRTTASTIPEPSSALAIMGLGLVGTAIRRRRSV